MITLDILITRPKTSSRLAVETALSVWGEVVEERRAEREQEARRVREGEWAEMVGSVTPPAPPSTFGEKSKLADPVVCVEWRRRAPVTFCEGSSVKLFM